MTGRRIEALRALRESQAEERALAGERWQDSGLVFTTHHGNALDAANVRKMFKRICKVAGIGGDWTPPELKTSFARLLSHRRVGIEEIARLAGHASTRTTEVVYRRELRPEIRSSVSCWSRTSQSIGVTLLESATIRLGGLT